MHINDSTLTSNLEGEFFLSKILERIPLERKEMVFCRIGVSIVDMMIQDYIMKGGGKELVIRYDTLKNQIRRFSEENFPCEVKETDNVMKVILGFIVANPLLTTSPFHFYDGNKEKIHKIDISLFSQKEAKNVWER